MPIYQTEDERNVINKKQYTNQPCSDTWRIWLLLAKLSEDATLPHFHRADRQCAYSHRPPTLQTCCGRLLPAGLRASWGLLGQRSFAWDTSYSNHCGVLLTSRHNLEEDTRPVCISPLASSSTQSHEIKWKISLLLRRIWTCESLLTITS